MARGFIFCLLFGLFPMAALAENITLMTKSGKLSITGTLLAFDDEVFQLDTDIGRITISNKNLTCRGKTCPTSEDRIEKFSFTPTDRMPRSALMALLQSHANDTQKIYSQKGPFTKPKKIEISHKSIGLESRISFQSSNVNLSFSADGTGPAIALDAVQIISTAPALKKPITAETLRAIWTGEISNWQDLGGVDQDIRLILPIFSDDLLRTIARFDPALSVENLTDKAEYYLSSQAILEDVERSEFAIGFLYETNHLDHTVTLDLGCGITAIPSPFSIQSMTYPLAFQITMNRNVTRLPKSAKRFQSYLNTDPAQQILQSAGLVALTGQTATQQDMQTRYINAITDTNETSGMRDLKTFTTFTKTASRLAVTLSFDQHGRALDARSQKIIPALINLLSRQTYKNTTVYAAGFSDNIGKSKANHALSKARADLVVQALQESVPNIQAIGFGEIAPIGCNDTTFGKAQNRRVEIWLQD